MPDELKEDYYNKILEFYSTFLINDIGPVIARLMSEQEKRDFVYTEALYRVYERCSTFFGSEWLNNTYYIQMVVDRNEKKDEYGERFKEEKEIPLLIKNKQALLLGKEEFSYNRFITFYPNTRNKKSKLDLYEYPYVKEFIDYVIQYRIDNKLDQITSIELQFLLEQYLKMKKNENKIPKLVKKNS